jgi:RsiW-degrading membrane proteinase PrsW (M82 family)
MTPLEAAALLVLFTFLPPLFFAYRLRNAERRGTREPWGRVLKAFFYGAFVAVVVAGFLEYYILRRYFGGAPVLAWGAVLVPVLDVIVAPVVEESSKILGLLFFRDASPEPENGYVYGGAVGLGFAATENLLYVVVAYQTAGQDVALALGVYRGVATVALHAAATAITGYGLWRLRFGPRRAVGAILFPASLLAAILVHAGYNAIANVEWGALVAIVFALVVFGYVRRRIRRLDGGQGTP